MRGSPHDALFKKTFTELSEAESLLRWELPPTLGNAIDWSTLTLEPGTYIDASLSSRHSDLLFSCWCGAEPVLLYLLLEHQRDEDSWMSYRMLRYVVRIEDGWLSAHPNATDLPAVIPIVVYQGARPWRSSREVLDRIGLAGDLKASVSEALPKMAFLLDALSRHGEEAIGRRSLSAFAELTLRALIRLPGSPTPIQDLERWLPLLRAMLHARHGLDRLRAVFEYAHRVSSFNPSDLVEVAAQLGPGAEEVARTAADELRREGRKEGRREGRKKGRKKGRKEGRAEVLLEQLAVRFGRVSEERAARVRGAELEQMLDWSRRVLTAATIDEVFDPS